jgi:hypothetical protein
MQQRRDLEETAHRRTVETAQAVASAVRAARHRYAQANPGREHPSDQVLAVAIGRLLAMRLAAEQHLVGWTVGSDGALRVMGTPTLVAVWLHPYAWRVMLRQGSAWEETAVGYLPGPYPILAAASPAAAVRRAACRPAPPMGPLLGPSRQGRGQARWPRGFG